MDIFDYRDKGETDKVDELSVMLDHLTREEAAAALSAISEARKTKGDMRKSAWITWFYDALLPILQEFSESSAAILTVDQAESHLIVSLKSEQGFDITDGQRYMRVLMAMASHVGINSADGYTELALIFSIQT